MNEARITWRSLATPRVRKTDWSQFDATTDVDIEATVHRNPDVAPLVDEEWFETAHIVEPPRK